MLTVEAAPKAISTWTSNPITLPVPTLVPPARISESKQADYIISSRRRCLISPRPRRTHRRRRDSDRLYIRARDGEFDMRWLSVTISETVPVVYIECPRQQRVPFAHEARYIVFSGVSNGIGRSKATHPPVLILAGRHPLLRPRTSSAYVRLITPLTTDALTTACYRFVQAALDLHTASPHTKDPTSDAESGRRSPIAAWALLGGYPPWFASHFHFPILRRTSSAYFRLITPLTTDALTTARYRFAPAALDLHTASPHTKDPTSDAESGRKSPIAAWAV
ncbi:hypothetical protein B0H11DRAFT_1905999 [Mycena galericulata]|nr:hypothetical protein B0H11DRAFT_1905999 [Mycena galericulata]